MNQAELKEWLDGFRFTPLVDLERVYAHGLENMRLSENHPKMKALDNLIRNRRLKKPPRTSRS